MTQELEVAFIPFHTLPLHFLCVTCEIHTHTYTHLIRLYGMHTKLHAQLSPEIAQQFSYLDNFPICLMLSGRIELLADGQKQRCMGRVQRALHGWVFSFGVFPGVGIYHRKRRIKICRLSKLLLNHVIWFLRASFTEISTKRRNLHQQRNLDVRITEHGPGLRGALSKRSQVDVLCHWPME